MLIYRFQKSKIAANSLSLTQIQYIRSIAF